MTREFDAMSDEKIISVLLASNTTAEAAEHLGVTVDELRDRMDEQKFRMAYCEAKADVLRAAVTACSREAVRAVDSIAAIYVDPETNPAVRLQAAQTLLNTLSKFNSELENEESKAKSIRHEGELDLWSLALGAPQSAGEARTGTTASGRGRKK